MYLSTPRRAYKRAEPLQLRTPNDQDTPAHSSSAHQQPPCARAAPNRTFSPPPAPASCGTPALRCPISAIKSIATVCHPLAAFIFIFNLFLSQAVSISLDSHPHRHLSWVAGYSGQQAQPLTPIAPSPNIINPYLTWPYLRICDRAVAKPRPPFYFIYISSRRFN